MRAELKWIEPNDFPAWEAYISADPLDDFGWFSAGIGPEGEHAADIFQVLVSTPAAVARAQGTASRFRGLIVERFEPDAVQATLRHYVTTRADTGSWTELARELASVMDWEYAGMHPHLSR